ncbi:hypothetical protein [Streptomyces sp. MBT65]|uniref:hypothetical protein n=1 Tax=Streptomyces sp. MBT65 TaxID=1488395 RepID=UPI001F2ADCD6|nr:hypothetical protein [Streptomyces sp. MBT65]
MGNTSEEADQLGIQASLYDRHTQFLLRTAGLKEGIHVLDVGCGMGEVSLCAALRAGGRNPDMGEQLAHVLRLSGLSDPRVAVAVPTGGPDSAAVTLIAESARSLLPVMERAGITTAEEADLDTLRARMSRACAEVHATVYVPELVAAWAELH